jgi:hypothetical protein
MISVQVDASKAIVRLSRMPEAVRRELRGETISLTKQLVAAVLANLSGAILQKRTGKLFDSFDSMKGELVETTTSLYGEVRSNGTVAYARILELGGVINHPGSSKFQAWQGENGWVFTHFTRPHKIPIPAFRYMGSALDAMRDEIDTRLSAAARRADKG